MTGLTARMTPPVLSKDEVQKALVDMTPFKACGVIEGFSGEEQTTENLRDAWSCLIRTGTCWKL